MSKHALKNIGKAACRIIRIFCVTAGKGRSRFVKAGDRTTPNFEIKKIRVFYFANNN